MSSFRAVAVVLVPLVPLAVLAGAAVDCGSSSSAPAAPSDAGDASPGDAPIGPLFCNIPVPATCPTTAPCSFAAWGCPEAACDGYFVVTDGTWNYYYSSVGGALAGEVLAADAAFVSCPYGFQPPPSCTPAIASPSQCTIDSGTSAESGTSLDGGSASDGGDSSDGEGSPDGESSADGAGDGESSSDSAGSLDSGNADGS